MGTCLGKHQNTLKTSYWYRNRQTHKTDPEWDSSVSNPEEINSIGRNDCSFRKNINEIQASDKFQRDAKVS